MAETRKATDRPTCHSRREYNTMGLNYHDEPRTDQTAQGERSHAIDGCDETCDIHNGVCGTPGREAQGEAGGEWECWTCVSQNHIGRIHRLGQRRCDCPSRPRHITGHPLYVGDEHFRLSDHVGHEVRPCQKQ